VYEVIRVDRRAVVPDRLRVQLVGDDLGVLAGQFGRLEQIGVHHDLAARLENERARQDQVFLLDRLDNAALGAARVPRGRGLAERHNDGAASLTGAAVAVARVGRTFCIARRRNGPVGTAFGLAGATRRDTDQADSG